VASYTATADFSGFNIFFEDDFETDLGWTVTNGPGLTTGMWQRVIPISNAICARGNPGSDVDTDGAGRCFVTQNSTSTADCDLDVDNGSTTLTSPNMDASDPQAILGYSRWYDNTGAGQGASPFQDIFVVEVSDDGGANWVNLETVGPNGQVTGGWFHPEFLVSAIPGITNSSQLRVRFTASDTNPKSCPGDLNGDGSIAIEDFLELLAAWGPNPGHPADLDGDGSVGINDFLTLLATWGPCE
jgi:hypothetical protein